MGEAIVASARDAAFVAAVNGAAGAAANPLGAIGSTGISAAALAAMTAPGFPAAHSGAAGAPHDLNAALLRQALVAAQVQAAQQRQRMAALASATAGVGGDVNALINALLGPRDVNPAVDPWKLVTAGSGADAAGARADADAPNPASAAATFFSGQASNATATNPLASLAALRALGGTLGVPGAATGANVSRGLPGSAPPTGGFLDDAAARAAMLFGARGGMGMPAGGAFGVNPSPFGVGAGTPSLGADARVAAAAALAAKGVGGGDDEAVAAAAAAFFAAMNAEKKTAVEDTIARGRDSAVSEGTDVEKEAAEEDAQEDAQPRKEGSVRSGVAALAAEVDEAEDDAPKAETPPAVAQPIEVPPVKVSPVEAPPVVALPSNVATAVAGGGD